MTQQEAIAISIIIGAIVSPFVKSFFSFLWSLIKKKDRIVEDEFVTRKEFTEKCKELKQEFASEFNAVEGKLSALDVKVDSNHNQIMSTLLQMQRDMFNAISGKKND